MTIIASDQDGGGGSAYAVQTDSEAVAVKSYVTMTGKYGIASDENYRFVTIFNQGDIFGTNVGVSIDGSESDVFNKSQGTINGQIAVAFSAEAVSLVNQGDVTGVIYGVYFGGSNSSISNSGHITGGDAIRAEANNVSIRNSGTIDGFSGIACGDASAVTVLNTGAITGGVVFGSGLNSFDGRGGTLRGDILGGTGADTVRLGSDGETVRGGDGVDRLYAGAGADTFVFSHLSQNDIDRVYGFNAARDTLELERTSFGKLATDAPVTFAVGSKAASANDFVFYNPASGGLYYDADGSGAKAAAHLIARLDPGLRLTAHDVQVVAG